MGWDGMMVMGVVDDWFSPCGCMRTGLIWLCALLFLGWFYEGAGRGREAVSEDVGLRL
ncbi:hypothetical protein M440DRAFT_1398894, partial [Trichoderma longibrachiatum ATCC 18648]